MTKNQNKFQCIGKEKNATVLLLNKLKEGKGVAGCWLALSKQNENTYVNDSSCRMRTKTGGGTSFPSSTRPSPEAYQEQSPKRA